MENQGFEEEQPRAKEPSVFSRESSIRDSRFSFRPDASVKNSCPDNSGSISDGHVYEDISPGTEDSSVHSNSFGSPDDARENPLDRNVSQKSVRNDHRRPFDIVNYISREALARTSNPEEEEEEEESSSFRRNLTLPFRRGTALDLGSSVRVTCRGRNSCQDDDDPELAAGNHDQPRENPLDRHRAQSAIHQADCRPGRRRRKKDCKHCRNKASVNDADVRENREMILKRNRENEEQQYGSSGTIDEPKIIGDRSFGTPPIYRGSGRTRGATIDEETSPLPTTVFAISEKIASGSPSATLKFIEYERNEAVRTNLAHVAGINEDKALIVPTKNRVGMRVNSIYSQERWYAKEAPIFFTDVKEHSSFQRAYSLPVRTQTPSSQNRVNLRRSVRGEPPPHPARLDKHRHGWTLHLARPLESSGCTRSLVLLLIVILVLLGVGAIALYIVFEPEKLQIIQQYLRSSTINNSSSNGAVPARMFIPTAENDERNETSSASSTSVAGVLLNGVPSFPESTPPVTETETEAASMSTGNSTRYCDDCVTGEVCVALVDEEVPICRLGLDHEDPTGCAGFCLINKQKCHRLDVDAFRCVEVDHYCLDDEWTCSNTLCIPLEKHCDGHMNCYDHSDEHNCVCNLETHFQCGNETSCLPLEKRCDGKIDCWDAADEINCTLACPMENEFTCSNGQCILKARFCDGLTDCADGSDEPHGCQGRCNKHEFTCQNSRCITKGMKCNGIDDCGDGTDERHCKDRFS